MGIQPDPTPGFSNHCPTCFGLDATPGTCKVFVSGLEPAQLSGGDPVSQYNGYYDVHPIDGEMCKFQSAPGADVLVWLSMAFPHTSLLLGVPGVGSLFDCGGYPSCTKWVENHNLAQNKLAWKGWAYICPSMELAAMASLIMNPELDISRYEFFVMANKQGVCRVARTKDATNIKILVDTDDLP